MERKIIKHKLLTIILISLLGFNCQSQEEKEWSLAIRPTIIGGEIPIEKSGILKDVRFNDIGFAIWYKGIGLSYNRGFFFALSKYDSLGLSANEEINYSNDAIGLSIKPFNRTSRFNVEFVSGVSFASQYFLKRTNVYFGVLNTFDIWRFDFNSKRETPYFLSTSLFVRFILLTNNYKSSNVSLLANFGVNIELSRLLIKDKEVLGD